MATTPFKMSVLRLTLLVAIFGEIGGDSLSAAVIAPKPKSKPVFEPRPSKEGIDFFEKKIRPVLVHSCYKCHSGDSAKAKAHFVLDTRDGLRKGGDTGEVVSPRHPEKAC